MKSIKAVVLLSFMLVLLLENPVLSANWVEYAKTKKGDVYSYNQSNVKNVSGDIRQCWERYDFASVINGVKSTTVLRQIDCKERTSRIISVIDYDIYGGVLHSNANYQSEWRDIPSDEKLEVLRKILCE